MSIILDRPYQFIPPHRGQRWPQWIQRLRLIDWHLRRNEGVVDYELRHPQRLGDSVAAGHSIILAPNHCRYADPVVLGWLSRRLNIQLHALASWHLFNTNAFERFALRRMGAYSILREANDRRALETSIDLIVDADRPLIIFPEGTTNRTNDRLKPLLDGVAFIARTAAKRRVKRDGGRVVIHPVGLKYKCVGDPEAWMRRQLATLSERLTWPVDLTPGDVSLVAHTRKLCDGFLALKELQYLGYVGEGPTPGRRDRLVDVMLADLERRYGVGVGGTTDRWGRIRAIRSAIYAAFFTAADENSTNRSTFDRDVDSIELAQFMIAFPDDYLAAGQATDMRLVETIERVQEGLGFKPDRPAELSIIIEVDEPIEVPADRAPRGQTDPLLLRLGDRLSNMLSRLSTEARLLDLPSKHSLPPARTADLPHPAPQPAVT